MKKNYIFYFTSTGNSLYIAKSIQEKIGGEILSIPQVLKSEKRSFKGTKLGIIFPCYAISVPPIVEEFLNKVKLEGDYNFSIMTYGKIGLGALGKFNNLANKNGITLDYLSDIEMVDNFLPIYKMEEQVALLPKKNIEENLKVIVEDLVKKKKFIKKKGILKQTISTIASKIEQGMLPNAPKNFNIDDSCTKCGICLKACPTDNISMVDGKLEFGKKCQLCLACIHMCPEGALHHRKERSIERYRNENISLKEILQSNN